jgi:glutathione S-transferase
VGGVPLAPLDRRCNGLAGTLAEDPFRMGQRYTVADPYLFTILDWTSVLAADLGHWPALKHYLARIAARPAVLEILKAEG